MYYINPTEAKQQSEIIMKTFKTLEQSLGTKNVIILSSKVFDYKGTTRTWIKAKKLNGKKIFSIAQYSNGLFSTAV